MRQPYGRHIASTVTYAHPAWWAQQGFLVVVQDVRGQGDSTGVFGRASPKKQTTQQQPIRGCELSPNAMESWVATASPIKALHSFSLQPIPSHRIASHQRWQDSMNETTGAVTGGAHWWHLGLGWGLQLAALQAKRRGDDQAWIQNSAQS